MPLCKTCGVQIPEGAEQCDICNPPAAMPTGKCLGCGAPFPSPSFKFCMQCGQHRKFLESPTLEPTPAAKSKPAGRVCSNCGQPAKSNNALFCAYCTAPFNKPTQPDIEPTPPPKPQPLNKEQKAEADSVAQARLAAYQKTGRLLLAACHAGQVDKASLPADLVSALDASFSVVARGHARLLAAGICPQCQDVSLDAESRTCLKCGLKAP